MMENRLAEIEGNLKENECKQAQANRFVKLVNKYKHIEELTTPMLNEFIEKIVVHEATGGRGKCIQRIDIYFNFIGQFVAPVKEEEIKQIEKARKEEKVKAKRKKERLEQISQSAKDRRQYLKENKDTDPEAAAEYEALLQRQRESNRRYRENLKKKVAENPEYAKKIEERRIRNNEKCKERYELRKQKELAIRAETNEQAAEEYTDLIESQKESRKISYEKHLERMETDTEYAENYRVRQKASEQKRAQKRKAYKADLKERAKTDPKAAKEYEAQLQKQRDYMRNNRSRKKELAETDPVVAEKLKKRI